MKGYFTKKTARLVGVLAAASAGLGVANVAAFSSAHADPAQYTASVAGVGSDTSQDVFDAFSGADPYPPSPATKFYVPLSSGGQLNDVIASFDAIPAGGSAGSPGCITTKIGGPQFDRPNGSSNGINALLAAVNGTGWQASTGSCTNTPVSVSNQIDFARSSRGPKTTGTTLTFIPFARDAVTVAYFDHGTAHLAQLTTAQLQSLYTSSGSVTINGDTVEGCLPQPGSGTRAFFEGAIGVTDAQAGAVAIANNCNTAEENGANTFYSFANALPAGTDVVIPFSVGSWIAQANGAALDRSATGRANGVNLSELDAIAPPYDGSGSNLTPDNTFYSSTQYGRNLFVVAPTNKVTGFGASAALKGLFVGATAAICSSSSQTTDHTFGFDSLTPAEGTCGATTLQGNS